MSQPISLGTFEPPSFQDGDSLQAQQIVDTPLLVLPLEKKWIKSTKFKPEGGDAIVVDLRNLVTGEFHLGVMWMNGAIVDGFAPYVGKGQVLPVTLRYMQPRKQGGSPYIGIEALTGQALETAGQWVAGDPAMFANERERRGWGPYVPEGQGTFEAPAQAAAPAPAPVAAPAPAPAPAPVAAPPVAPPPAAPAPVAAPPAAPVAAAPSANDTEAYPF